MDIDTFIKELKKINIELSQEQLDNLNKFYEILIQQNKIINLTRITNKDDVYLKHFYDSLTLIKAYDLNKKISVCDVGSGAGFPGIVLKIVFPNLKIILIDSLKKRVDFLSNVIKSLKLNNIKAIHCRMEDYSKINKEKFDLITSRAVARLEILTEICISSLKIGGHLIFMKGSCDEELLSLKKCVKLYNSKINNYITFYLPFENSIRSLVDIIKISTTSIKYPRSVDKIKKDYNLN